MPINYPSSYVMQILAERDALALKVAALEDHIANKPQDAQAVKVDKLEGALIDLQGSLINTNYTLHFLQKAYFELKNGGKP